MDFNHIKNAVEILSKYEDTLYDQDEFAKKFTEYVVSTYNYINEKYYFKTPGMEHVSRNIDEVHLFLVYCISGPSLKYPQHY